MKNKKKRAPLVNRDRFIESVYHIVFYGNTIRSFNATLRSVGNKINAQEAMIIRYSIQWNVLIMFVSLSDELSKFLFKYRSKDEGVSNRTKSYKHIIDPILIEIRKWHEIRSFRNNVLAHNLRIDSDEFKSVHLTNKIDNYNIPNSTIDLVTLFKYVDSITKVAEEIFKEEYEEAKAIVEKFGEKNKRIQIPEDEIERANKVLLEVNNRINKFNTE